MELTQDWLKEHTEFSEEKKTLVWKKPPSIRAKKGQPIGAITKDGYYRTANQQVHRLVWLFFTGSMPIYDLDHINGIRTDNRIENLREASRGLNTQNRKKTNGYSYLKNRSKPWRAHLRVNYKFKHIGYFATKEEARAAYLEAKRKYHPFFVEEQNDTKESE